MLFIVCSPWSVVAGREAARLRNLDDESAVVPLHFVEEVGEQCDVVIRESPVLYRVTYDLVLFLVGGDDVIWAVWSLGVSGLTTGNYRDLGGTRSLGYRLGHKASLGYPDHLEVLVSASVADKYRRNATDHPGPQPVTKGDLLFEPQGERRGSRVRGLTGAHRGWAA